MTATFAPGPGPKPPGPTHPTPTGPPPAPRWAAAFANVALVIGALVSKGERPKPRPATPRPSGAQPVNPAQATRPR